MQVDEPRDERLCFTRQILDRIGDKWSIAVIYQLGQDDTLRFTELKRGIEGISQRMLTVTLRALERDGLVDRTVHPVIPPRVEYRLTELGQTLLDNVCGLMDWSLNHADDVADARAAYDEKAARDQTG